MNYKSRLQRNIRLYYLSEFIGNLLFIIPVWVSFQLRFLTFAEMSLLTSARFLLTTIMEMPSGAFADLVGRKISCALGNALDAVAVICVAFAGGPSAIYIGTLTRGIAESFVSGSNLALVYDSLKELGRENEFSRIRANGIMYIQISIIISSILAGYLYQLWPGLPYLAFAIGLFINALIFLQMQEPNIDSERFTLRSYFSQLKLGLNEAFKDNYVSKLSIFYGLIGGATWSYQIHLNQILAYNIGYDEIGRSWLFAIIRFINAFILIKLLKIDKIFNRRSAFIIFPLTVGVASLLTLINSSPWVTLLIFILTLSSTLRFIVLDKFTNEHFASKYRATAISALNMIVGFQYAILIAAFGSLLDKFYAGWVYAIVGAIILLIALPLGIKLAYTKHIINNAS